MHVTSLHVVPLKSNSSRLSLLWFATEVVVVACADLSSGGGTADIGHTGGHSLSATSGRDPTCQITGDVRYPVSTGGEGASSSFSLESIPLAPDLTAGFS